MRIPSPTFGLAWPYKPAILQGPSVNPQSGSQLAFYKLLSADAAEISPRFGTKEQEKTQSHASTNNDGNHSPQGGHSQDQNQTVYNFANLRKYPVNALQQRLETIIMGNPLHASANSEAWRNVASVAHLPMLGQDVSKDEHYRYRDFCDVATHHAWRDHPERRTLEFFRINPETDKIERTENYPPRDYDAAGQKSTVMNARRITTQKLIQEQQKASRDSGV